MHGKIRGKNGEEKGRKRKKNEQEKERKIENEE